MCGIYGAFGRASASYSIDPVVLRHRGPDHADAMQLQSVLLGHTRLAIVDVEHGQQPLQSPDGRYWVISNGEIYNHEAIRQRLADKYTFQTDTDSEVILALYQEYGTDAVKHMDGMFAFVLYDTQRDTVYMGRDPIGIKPLYYGWENNTLYFASEMKALQDVVGDMQEFPPGHWYSTDNVQGIVPYYSLKAVRQRQAPSQPPTPDDIRLSLTNAVRKRLMSDVPLGVYLSGGLDSTIVAALVAQEKPGVHSFAVGTTDSEDLKNAREAARLIGTHHHEYVYDREEMLAALPEIIYYLESFDPLLVRSAIPNYFLARMTRQYVTVVLTGEGADELYAGYHYLKNFKGEDALQDELVALVETLYNCNLQRCDRMTMAHSIEARVPFLDTDFIALSMQVPADQKIEPRKQIEKWVLRKAFEDIVPKHVAWRVKEQFSKGAGSSELLVEIADEQFSDAEFTYRRSQIAEHGKIDITSKEMLMYYEQFRQHFSLQAAQLVKVWRGN